MNYQPQNSAPTFESVWASIQESNRFLTEKFAKTDRFLNEKFAEADRLQKENERILNEKFAETDRLQKETDRQMKALQKELGGIAHSNGEVAESYFVNSFANSMQFAGQKYDSYTPNLQKNDRRLNLQGEYDLVLYNCSSVVIIEIKYKAHEKDIDELVEKVPIFKKLYPEYANYDIYLGLAALHLNSAIERKSKREGIAVIKQVGDTMVINDAHLKVF